MIGKAAVPRALFVAFGLASLAATAIGAAAGAAHGAPVTAWARNLAAWVIGALLAAAIAAGRRSWPARLMLWLAPVGLAACFLSPGQQGVHRWVDLGPLHVNMAMLLLPAMVVALPGLARERTWSLVAAFAALGLLAAQPDASQGLALAAAATVVVIGVVRRPAIRLALLGAAFALAAVAWMRPDPLQPVAEVEGVIGLAYSASPLLAGLAMLCLAAAAAAPAVLTWRCPPAARLAGRAMSACLLVWMAAPFLGAFPVPFAGIGPSPIIGAWLAIGLLAVLARLEPETGEA